jgi:NAD(P)-dependent dehydrogenase (short-subunit alcohol dehydrogenase family)
MGLPGMALPELAGRTAVITGASRGLGAGLARHFAAKGMRLALCARGELPLADGADVVAERFDITDESALERFTATAAARLGPLDLWINNAALLAPIAPVRDVSAAAFREHVDVTLTGAFLGTRAYVRHVRARKGGGVLINVSSGAAVKPYEGWGAYCAAKAGLLHLTNCVAQEERDSGLLAYSVAPGVVDTGMQALIRASTPDQFPQIERFKDLKRDDAFNSPEFVAEHLLAVAFAPDYPNGDPANPLIRVPDEK